MKNKVLIIEDNYYRFFTTKQLLKSQLKFEIDIVGAKTGRDVARSTAAFNPDTIMFCPQGGVAELLSKMKQRRMNRRNTEIVLMVLDGSENLEATELLRFVKEYPKLKKAA